jgi:hypothetical protein
MRLILVSSLSGVPTPAFRGREVRQVSFTPEKAQSRHCRYSDGDVRKATLLKRLTDQGRATSNIVCIDTRALNVLLQRRQVSNQTRAREHRQYGSYQYPSQCAYWAGCSRLATSIPNQQKLIAAQVIRLILRFHSAPPDQMTSRTRCP